METRYTNDLAAGLTQVLADGSNTYLYGLGRIAQQQAGTQYFGADGLESVRQLYNDAGEIIANRRYDPFGNTLSTSGSGSSVYGFTGEQYDGSTGLVFLRARYYDPSQGRFLARDQWMGDPLYPTTLHRYVYVMDNPILYIDPKGSQTCPQNDVQCQILEHLRQQAEGCYKSRDMACLWRVYLAVAVGGAFRGYPHAAFHLLNFLYKGGDITYNDLPSTSMLLSSRWIADALSVKLAKPSLEQEALDRVNTEARSGMMRGTVETGGIGIAPNPVDEGDLYYAMNRFSLKARGPYQVSRIHGCFYRVMLKLTYEFFDRYDWHIGLMAGGNVAGLGRFRDDWTKALAEGGWAAEFDIRGFWMEPARIYVFDYHWL